MEPLCCGGFLWLVFESERNFGFREPWSCVLAPLRQDRYISSDTVSGERVYCRGLHPLPFCDCK